MPPKAKITKEMIVDTAFSIAQNEGIEKVTARSISEALKCSTQPILYYCSSVIDIKKAVYEKADEYHTNYIMRQETDCKSPLLTIGINYIKFAIEERNLFCLLFQTNEFSGACVLDMIKAPELTPIIDVLQRELSLSREDAIDAFSTLFIFAHGYASLYANNTMVYHEAHVISALERVFNGAIGGMKGK